MGQIFQEQESLNSYTVSTCESKIQELVAYIVNPIGEQHTIPSVLGQLATGRGQVGRSGPHPGPRREGSGPVSGETRTRGIRERNSR